MVMAAGLGTRLRPLTDHLPKPMAPVANRPVLQHLLERLAAAGVEGAIVNLHYFPDAIRSYFGDRHGLPVAYSYEAELLGTAGGTKRCERFLADGGDDCFLVTSGDGLHDVDLAALIARHRASGATATLALKPVAEVEQFGVAVVDEEGLIREFQEKPSRAEARSDLANLGVYCLSTKVLERIPADTFYDFGKQVLPELLADGEPMAAFVTEAYWSDVGSIDELVTANLATARGETGIRPGGRDLGDGVFVEDGASVDPGAELVGPVLVGRDATIAAGAQITGPAVIGPGCTIGRNAAIKAAVLLPGATVPSDGLVAGGIIGDADRLAEAWRHWPAR